MMNPRLSIVCPSVRPHFLDQALVKQVFHPHWRNEVEFLMLHDNDWRSTGRKRQMLVEMARGDYIMQVDDDDIVSPQLIPWVLDHGNPKKYDVLTFDIRIIHQTWEPTICGIAPWLFEGEWQYEIRKDEKIQYRMWHPICPTRRELFEGVEYPDICIGEDTKMSETIGPKLKTWLHNPEELYFAFPTNNNPNRTRKGRNPRYES